GFGLRLTDADTGDLWYGVKAHPGFRVHVPFEAAVYEAGRAGGAGEGSLDLVAATYRLLTYQDERDVPETARDRRGAFLSTALPPARQQTADRPLVEEHAA